MKNSKRRSQRGRRFVSTCSFLLSFCWLAFAAWNLGKKPEELSAFLIGFNLVAAIIIYSLPKAIARFVYWVNGSSPTSEAIREMQSMRTAKNEFQSVPSQSQIETGLSEAWTRLVRDADDLLLNLVAEKAKTLRGHEPTREQVLDFLRGLQEVEAEPKEAPAPSIQPVSEPTATPQAENRRRALSLQWQMGNG